MRRPLVLSFALLAAVPALVRAQAPAPSGATYRPDSLPDAEEQERVRKIKAKGWLKWQEKAVIERRLEKGMTMPMVALALGQPVTQLEDRSETGTQGVQAWRWEYPGNFFVWFRNGEVSAWRTLR
ncbi:MAG: hypothetical protein NW201_09910 [Gemmatimonadales bacterium]|nr:hypothetical protein [Gemmatimonadales bacterium]